MDQAQLEATFDRQSATYDQQWAKLAAFREGIHLLLDTIERTGRPPRRVVLATELVTRASSTGRGRG